MKRFRITNSSFRMDVSHQTSSIDDIGTLNPAPSTDCLHKLRRLRAFLVLLYAQRGGRPGPDELRPLVSDRFGIDGP
jgi:hypothetical protein